MFGNPASLAIEVGKTTTADDGTQYVQARLIIADQPFGNWEELISLRGCAANMKEFLKYSKLRRNPSAKDVAPEKLFASTFDAFFDYDYSSQPVLRPNLRDIYHLNEIGLGALRDQYGIVVVEVSQNLSRVVAKDLQRDQIILDHLVETSEITSAGTQFIHWTEGNPVS